MTILNLIRDHLTRRGTDAATKYWAALAKVATSEKLPARALGALLDDIHPLLAGLGKDAAAVEADVTLLQELAQLKDAPALLEKARAEARSLNAEATAMQARANELAFEIERLRKAAEGSRSVARAVLHTGQQRADEFGQVSGRLARAGHPEFAALAARTARQREIESLRGELQNLDVGISATQGPPAARRATIRARLAELGADTGDAGVVEPVGQEVIQ